jgi:hypothetical protein
VSVLQTAHIWAFGTHPCNSKISYLPWHIFMASLYYKVYWNKITLLVNQVFTKVFNFQWRRLTSRHAPFHSLRPLPDFLVHVIVLYKVNYVAFKLTSLKPRHIVTSLQTYWHVLLKAWPKQEPC